MAKWKPLDQMSILSKRYPRVDGPDKVSGRAKYTWDLLPKGCLYGRILSSPHPAARITRVQITKAEKLPGVKAILTDLHPTGNILYAGDFVAAVAAETPEIARDAIDLIRVRYDRRPFAADLDAAMQEGAPRVFTDRDNVAKPRKRGEGDVEKGFAESDAIVEGEYRTQVQTHSCLETHGSVAMWEGDELTIWDSTQGVHQVRQGLAGAMQMPASKVRVICQHMGAGFGSKLQPGRYSVIAANLAKKAGAPVKLMLTRDQDSMTAGNRPDSLQKVKLGAKKDGAITAFEALTYGTAGIGRNASVAHPYVYEIPNWVHTHHDVSTNAGASRAFRAPGRPQACFAMEGILDEMAAELEMDPLEIRLRNDPNKTRHKQWRIGAEKIGWNRRNQKPGSPPGPLKRGLGLAASIWAVPGRGTKAELILYPDGEVEIKCGTQDIGTGTRTIVAAIVAEELGIPIENVRPLIGDSDYPTSVGSGGSMTMPSVAPAIKNTAEKAREWLTELARKTLGVEDVAFADGKVSGAGKSVSFKELCAGMGNEPESFHGEWVTGLSGIGVAGCQFADVEVDVRTGRISVEKIVAVADCGLILDRLTTESQVNGGVIQGLSYALFEERIMDPETGAQINPGFEDYKIAGALETPEIEVIFYDEPERGVMGIGEPPTIPTAAAIANAVYNATGVRLRRIPMTPDRVLMALEEG